MKYIYLVSNIVREIIPEYDPAFPDIPINERYAPDFLAQCIAVPEDTEVSTGMIYDPDTGEFSTPPEPPEPVAPDEPTTGGLSTDDLLMLALVELYEQQQASEDMIMLALAEIYELTLGGM